MNLKKVAQHNIDVIGDASYRGDCPSETAEMIGFYADLAAGREVPEGLAAPAAG